MFRYSIWLPIIDMLLHRLPGFPVNIPCKMICTQSIMWLRRYVLCVLLYLYAQQTKRPTTGSGPLSLCWSPAEQSFIHSVCEQRGLSSLCMFRQKSLEHRAENSVASHQNPAHTITSHHNAAAPIQRIKANCHFRAL